MEFKNYKLGDLLLLKTQGVNTATDNVQYESNGIKIVQAKNIEPYKVTFDSKNFINEKTFARMKENHILKKGDILFTNIGSQLGNSAIYNYDEKAIITWNVMKLIPNEKLILGEYLCYNLNYFKNEIKSLNSSSTMPFVSGKELMNFNFNIPNVLNQRKTIQILKKINKKIDLNSKINDNLSNLIKEIYKCWFIDFKLSKNTQLVNTEIGRVPLNWPIISLGEMLKIERGLSYKGKYLADKGVPMINLGNIMPNGIFRFEKNKYYSGEYKEKVTIKPGEIVIANTDMTQNREVIGTPVIVPNTYNDNEIIFSHHIYGIKELKLPKMFVFYTLLTDRYRGIVKGAATGTTVLNLPKEIILDYKIALPNSELLESFEILANNVEKQKEILIKENLYLEKLRDTLLPKLMNGEIDLDKIEI